MAKEFLTVVETAAELGLSRSQVSNRITRGKIKATKRGSFWTITRTEVNRVRRLMATTREPNELS